MHVSAFTPHQCSFVDTQIHGDSYITPCECTHQAHVGQHGDINAYTVIYIVILIILIWSTIVLSTVSIYDSTNCLYFTITKNF